MGQLFASKATSSVSFNSVISIIPNPNFCTPLREACILMDKEKTGALIVTDYDNKTLGLLTSRDIQKAVANKQSSVLCIKFSDINMFIFRYIHNISVHEYRDCMTKKEDLITVKETTGLYEAAKLMMDHQVSHLPIMDRLTGQYCIGMLSIKDIVGEAIKQYHNQNHHIQDIIINSRTDKQGKIDISSH